MAERKAFHPVRRPGAATRKAKRAGLSLGTWARKHYHDPGTVGKEARFVEIRKKWHPRTGPRKPRRGEHRATRRTR